MKLIALFILLILDLTCVRISLAQTASAPAIAEGSSVRRGMPKKTLYLVEFSQPDSALFSQLGGFATTFFQLRLSQLNRIRVERRPFRPRCINGAARGTADVAGVQGRASAATDELPGFVLQGSIEAHSAGPEESGATGELVLNYELSKWERCRATSIYRRSETLPAVDVLDSFAIVSDLLADRVNEEASQRVTVTIQSKQALPDDKEQKALYKDLVRAITQRLQLGNDFRPVDRTKDSGKAAEYKLDIDLTFTRTRNIFRGFMVSGVEATFFVEQDKHVYRINHTPLRGTFSERDAFYADAVEAAVKGLEQVHFAREANLTEELNNMETEASAQSAVETLSLAKKYLCVGTEAGCTVRAEAALPLLTQVAENLPQDRQMEGYSLLGRAQYLIAQYQEAGKSYNKALSLSSSSMASAELAEIYAQAGDAWYRTQDYDQATQNYRKALEISARLPDARERSKELRVQLARSLRFARKPLEALAVLVSAPETAIDPQINFELQGLVAALSLEELATAITAMEQAGNSSTIQSSLLTAHSRAAALQMQRQEFGGAAEHLTKADALISDTTSKDARIGVLRLHAYWYELAKDDALTARKAIEQLLALDDSPQWRYERARYRLREAQLGDPNAPSTKQAYRDAAEWVTPLVNQRFSGAEIVLRLSNHELGPEGDRSTRDILDKVISSNPDDVDALVAQMYVCTEDLKDFTCALKYATLAEKAAGANMASDRKLDIIEIYVLNRKYDKALERIKMLTKDSFVEPRLQVVNNFYLTWTFAAKGSADEMRTAAAQWKSQTTDIRALKIDLGWVFDGAEKALKDEPNIAPDRREVLGRMLAAMRKPNEPLPERLF